ncbi:hypothetical protein NCS57_00083500 [Fusarium keratoplasticum]|uniref:Uncharacterized protein n=1 Tax=Fusarium keratoplasticum TaxID=1328300 RepID=A0ACC0REF7_9HYPO|nr:hypothetical protein NCS57_00083500 [Fusarium keratoplasticum]KAI8684177.1 hypothetical protein NCS57_00083500 [Fusarium keratoplasticum]KAI8688290.1 hypothetical protein NCS55_00082600 [Fusarium keratoplasticum]
MDLYRRRSDPVVQLPVSPEPSQSQYCYPLLSSFPLSANPVNQTTRSTSKLEAKAQALCSMNFELNLRNLNAHALRLERNIQRLAMKTAGDQDFRRENEATLAKYMREVEAVKIHLAQYGDKPPVTRADIAKLQQEMLQEVAEWKAELDDIRAQLDALRDQNRQFALRDRNLFEKIKEMLGSNQMPEALLLSAPPAPSPASATRALPAQQSNPRMETRAMRRERLDAVVLNRQQQLAVSSDHEYRITETINSTKRWNREHKVTKCSDPEFIANYLMKQGRRDPGIAKVLQRAIQKRVFQAIKMETGEPWRPHDLTELCHSVAWRDVIDVATEVLVTKRHRTVQLLAQM